MNHLAIRPIPGISLALLNSIAVVVATGPVCVPISNDRVEYRSREGFQFYRPTSWQPVDGNLVERAQFRIDAHQTPSAILEYMIRSPRDQACTLNVLQLPALPVDPTKLPELPERVWSEASYAAVTIQFFESKPVFVANHRCHLSSWTVDNMSPEMFGKVDGVLHSDLQNSAELREPACQRQLMIFGNRNCYIVTSSSRRASRAEADRAFLMVVHSFSIDRNHDLPQEDWDGSMRLHTLDVMQNLDKEHMLHQNL